MGDRLGTPSVADFLKISPNPVHTITLGVVVFRVWFIVCFFRLEISFKKIYILCTVGQHLEIVILLLYT
jgi:hypothetical protein